MAGVFKVSAGARPAASDQREMKVAEAAHEDHRRSILTLFGSVMSFGTEALKAAALINGGAAGATLALLSQTISSRPDLSSGLIGPLRCFGAGVISAGLAMAVGYFAQVCFHQELVKQAMIWNWPFIERTASSRKWLRAGIALQGFAITLGLLSFVCAVVGFWVAADVLGGRAPR